MVYEVKDLKTAREYLQKNDKKVTLKNPKGSTRYYGMRVIDAIFQILLKEFPDKINSIIVDAYDDYCAFVTARNLGYTHILFNNSKQI